MISASPIAEIFLVAALTDRRFAHALKRTERSFEREGVRYVGMEPVGPAKVRVGQVSGASGWHLFWGSAEARALKTGVVVDPGEVPTEPLPEVPEE